MKRRFLAITLCLVMILSCLSLTGCGKKDETFKIGFVGALTGSSAIAGKAVVNAVETAVKEINDAGGINGMKVEFVYRDDESDATKNLTMVEELLYKEKVDFIFGAVNSGSCAASLDIINEAKIPEIITDATSSALIDVEKYPYTFRNTMTNYTQAESLVVYAKEGGFKSIVVIGDTTDLGKDGFATTKKFAEEYGITIKDYISYTANDADLTAVAQSIKQNNADCVIAWTYANDGAKVVKALDRLDYLDKIVMYGYSGLANVKFMEMCEGSDCSNIVYLGGLSGYALEPGAEKLEGKYQEYYDKVEELLGVYNKDGSGRTTTLTRFMRVYDSVYFIKWIVEEKTKTKDGTAIKEAIESFGSEYRSLWSDYPYAYSATNHEGFNVNDCSLLTMEAPLVNDYVTGDIAWKYNDK